jgi:Fe-S cluster assembly scaffold protein SufB
MYADYERYLDFFIETSESEIALNFLDFNEVYNNDDLVNYYLKSSISKNDSILTLLSWSLLRGGGVLYIPSDANITKPLYLSYQYPTPIGFMIVIVSDTSSFMEIIENDLEIEDSKREYSTKLMNIFLNDVAKLNYSYINNYENQKNICIKNINLKKSSVFKQYSSLLGGKGIMVSKANLSGPLSCYIHQGMYVLMRKMTFMFFKMLIWKKNLRGLIFYSKVC